MSDIEKTLLDFRKEAKKGLLLGAGGKKIPGLISCDLFHPEAELKVNATNLSMFENGSINIIEAHHLIEHLSLADTDRALSEWQRVLCDHGTLILTFPDLLRVTMMYLKYYAGFPIFPRPERLDYIVKMLVGSQEHEGMFHKNAFDFRRITRVLQNHGFRIEFTYFPFPLRYTPSRLVIAKKYSGSKSDKLEQSN